MVEFGSKKYLDIAKEKAKRVGVDVEYSKLKDKKLAVYKQGKKIGDIGFSKMSDYIQHQDKDRRRRYKQRFQSTRNIKGSKSYYADKILW